MEDSSSVVGERIEAKDGCKVVQDELRIDYDHECKTTSDIPIAVPISHMIAFNRTSNRTDTIYRELHRAYTIAYNLIRDASEAAALSDHLGRAGLRHP
jgi:hypothetical protein